MHHGATDAAARVVRAEGHRIGATDLTWLGPVQPVGATLVTDPVGVRVPERSRIEGDDSPTSPGEALRQHAATCAGTDDDQVDLLLLVVPAHVTTQVVGGPGTIVRKQPGRFG